MSQPRLKRTDLLLALEAELDLAGFRYREARGRKHGRLLVAVGDREEPIIISTTPSDHRAVKNAVGHIRRKIAAWKAEAADVARGAASALSPPTRGETTLDSMNSAVRSIETIEVLGRQIAKVEYMGQRMVTLRQIDEAHEKAEGQARKQFNAHRKRFIDGVDYYVLDSISLSEFRTVAPFAFSQDARHGMLFTERGYGKIVKGWNDDLSWQLHDAMQDAYFMLKELTGLVGREGSERIASDDGAILDLIIAGNQDVLAAQSRSAQDLVEHIESGKAAVLRYLKIYVRQTLDGLSASYSDHRRSMQRRDQALATRMDGVERSVTAMLKAAEQPLQSRSFVFADWYDHDRIYQEFFPEQIIPNRRFLSQAISKSLDAYCKKRQRGFDMQSRRIGGRNVNLWHRDSVKPWLEVCGREIVRAHLAKSRRADPVVVAFGARK